jgi:hypothetical protein
MNASNGFVITFETFLQDMWAKFPFLREECSGYMDDERSVVHGFVTEKISRASGPTGIAEVPSATLRTGSSTPRQRLFVVR